MTYPIPDHSCKLLVDSADTAESDCHTEQHGDLCLVHSLYLRSRQLSSQLSVCGGGGGGGGQTKEHNFNDVKEKNVCINAS